MKYYLLSEEKHKIAKKQLHLIQIICDTDI